VEVLELLDIPADPGKPFCHLSAGLVVADEKTGLGPLDRREQRCRRGVDRGLQGPLDCRLLRTGPEGGRVGRSLVQALGPAVEALPNLLELRGIGLLLPGQVGQRNARVAGQDNLQGLPGGGIALQFLGEAAREDGRQPRDDEPDDVGEVFLGGQPSGGAQPLLEIGAL
jgi:hypothetical protein